jgi:hypothetical protein
MGIGIGNAGNMPARQVGISYDCPDAPVADNVSDPFPLAKWKPAQIGSVIGPKQGFSLQGCNVPIGTINEAMNSLRLVFYVVKATYIDGFYLDRIRKTQVSRVLRFDPWGGQSLQFTGPHNCTDDDCPNDP